VIQLQGIERRFGSVAALRGVALEVQEGEQLALVGPSGAGKTTLFNVLNFTLLPDAGTYRFDGVEAAEVQGDARREVRRRIATIHQSHDLVGRLSTLKNVLSGRLGYWGRMEALRNLVAPSRAAVAAVHGVLERVGIAEKLDERADRLSGGQKQRVAIARALFQDAELILADEPVASVDPARAVSLLELLTQTARDDGRTLIVSLHQAELARRFFPRIVGLHDGRVAFDRPTEELSEDELAAFFQNGSPSPSGL